MKIVRPVESKLRRSPKCLTFLKRCEKCRPERTDFFNTPIFGAASEERFDFYAAINEEHFSVPTSRAFHVLCHHEPRLS